MQKNTKILFFVIIIYYFNIVLLIIFGFCINLYMWYPVTIISIIAKTCTIFIHILFLNISYFQLKNSNISNIEEKLINHIYHINHLIFMNIEVIYNTENKIKNNIEYIIGNGKIGTWKGTGEYALLYNISIQKYVSLQYTCHHKNAHIYQINNINRNDKTRGSINLINFFSFLFNLIIKTIKNHIIAQTSEKL